MKALAVAAYGSLDSLAVIDLPDPLPARGQVRVRVSMSALNPADFKVISGEVKFLHGRNFPLVVGYDFAGIIDTLGADVQGFAVGDRVFGFLAYGSANRQGAFAQYVCADVNEIAKLPSAVGDAAAAAAATPALTALQAIRDVAAFRAGGRALVTGVSGGVGSLALGVVARLGGTAVALGSTRAKDLAQRYQCAQFVDRNAADPVIAAGEGFDLVFDAAAAYRWATWSRAMNSGATYVTTLPSAAMAVDFLRSLFASSRVRFVIVKSRAADLEQLAAWLNDGLHVEIDSTIRIADVATALQRLQQGKVLGRVVVDVANSF